LEEDSFADFESGKIIEETAQKTRIFSKIY